MTRHIIVVCIAAIMSFAAIQPAICEPETPKKVLLVPFSIHSDKDYSYIITGINDQIKARLSQASLTVVSGTSTSDMAAALKQATEKKADYLITGSMTFFGESTSITASLHETQTGASLLNFSKADPDKNQLFNRIGEFSDQAVAKVAPTLPPVKPVANITPPARQDISGATVLTEGILKTKPVKAELTAMAMGNIYGDGKKSIVFIDRHTLFIGAFAEKDIKVTKTITGKRYLNNIYISCFDANKNGIDEIFVTAVQSRTNKVDTTVYEWNGSDFAVIAVEVPWFFNTGKVLETGKPTLLGQAQDFTDDIFTGPVVEMTWNAGLKAYAPFNKLPLKGEHTLVYGFDSGDLYNSKGSAIVRFLPGDYLGVFDSDSDKSWKSGTRFGGMYKYIEPTVRKDTQDRYYLPARIMAGDFDRDGASEFATVVNDNSTPNMFSNLKNFTSGHIECLQWKTLNFETLWKTQEAPGFIPDFIITDIDGDGTEELVYCVVEKIGSLFKTTQTFFVIQPIRPH